MGATRVAQRLILVATTTMMCVWGFPAVAENHQEAVGFTRNHILVGGGGGEFIDQANGAVNVSIPIGQSFRVGPRLSYRLTLSYGSHFWRVATIASAVQSSIKRKGPFGVGWTLHMGRIERSQDFDVVTAWDSYSYHSPDGSIHPFSPQTASNIGVTMDGTFIRALREDETVPGSDILGWTLTFPNATSAHFVPDPDDPTSYRVEKFWGPELNAQEDPYHWMTVTYEPDDRLLDGNGYPLPDQSGSWRCIAQIDDSMGRTITFTNSPDEEGGHTVAITQPVFDPTPTDGNPSTATWNFVYLPGQTLYSPDCATPPNCSSAQPDEIESAQYLLQRVELPPGGAAPSIWREFEYEDGGVITDGLLRRRYLPREAPTPPDAATVSDDHYSYEYSPHTFTLYEWMPAMGYSDWTDHQTNVVTRKELHFGTETHAWTWDREYDTKDNPLRVEALDPDSNLTVYEFHGDPQASNAWDRGTYYPWQHGLPRQTEQYAGSGIPLSIEIWDYDAEWIGPLGAWYEYPQVTQSWSGVAGAGGFQWTVTWRLDLDTYGHPRETVVQGDGPGEYRRTYTDWTIETDTSQQDAWFPNGWATRIVHDEYGRPLSQQDATFGPTGLVQSMTSRVNPGGSTSPRDVNVAHTYDPDRSFRTSSILSGGDTTATFTSAYEYQTEVTDQETYFARSRPGSMAWYSSNRDVDWATGLPRRGLDPNDESPMNSPGTPGHPTADGSTFQYDTTYEWDELGRLTAIQRAGATDTTITYTSIGQTDVEQCAGVGDCRRSIYLYDTLGRLIEERRQRKSGSYDCRQTAYDWAGRVLEQTVWFPLGATTKPKTTLDYQMVSGETDPFGRVWTSTAPEGAVTTFYHTGNSKSATVNVDGTDSTTTWHYDSFGRLESVDAPEGADAKYFYDVVGRMLRAELSDGQTTQVRSFTYDALGRLTTSSTPEGGVVHVSEYDAAGNPVKTLDAKGRRLESVYDEAGRVLQVVQDGRVLAQNTYDDDGTGNPTQLARLVKAESFDDWGVPTSTVSFVYGDSFGRLSQQRLEFAAWQGHTDVLDGDPVIEIDYTYDAWGELEKLGYPLLGPDRITDQIPELQYNKLNGWLTTIEDIARLNGSNPSTLLTVDAYMAAGSPRLWTAGNGVQTTWELDDQFRPERIYVGPETNPLWDSGTYVYDAAGNITQIGSDVFDYDLLSQLTHATINIDFDTDDQDEVGNEVWTEDYTYDAFGNMLERMQYRDGNLTTSMTLGVDPTTNRILTANTDTLSWDPSGNLVRDPSLLPSVGGAPETAVLSFDGRGRLTGIGRSSDSLWAERFSYDSGGLRLSRTQPDLGLTTFYLRDASGQVLAEYVKPSESSQPSVWSRDYFYALGGTLAVASAENPDPPTGLMTSAVKLQGKYDVTLSWEGPAVGGADKTYRIFRRVDGESSYSQLTEIQVQAGTAGMYQDLDLPSDDYFYFVREVSATDVEGEDSRWVLVDTGAGTPSNVVALASEVLEGAVRLSWSRVSTDLGEPGEPTTGFAGYRVERRDSPTGPWIWLTPRPIREASFLDPAPPLGAQVEYRVTTINSKGSTSSGGSISLPMPTKAFLPSAPGGLIGSAGPGEQEASIRWEPSPAPENVMEYRVYELVGSSWNIITPTVTSGTKATVSGTERQAMLLAVTAVDDLGNESPRSASVTVRPALLETSLARTYLTLDSRDGTEATLEGTGGYVNVYRREEGTDPDIYLRRNAQLGALASGWTDMEMEECKAYVYVAAEAETTHIDGFLLVPTGEESATSPDLRVERHLIAAKPSVSTDPGANEITMSWDVGTEGFLTCASGYNVDYAFNSGDGYNLFRWNGSGWTSVDMMVDPHTPGYAIVFAPPDNAAYWYSVRLSTTNLHEQSALWRSPYGDKVCVSINGVEEFETACIPVPPQGGGGGSGGAGNYEPPAPPPQMQKITENLCLPTENPNKDWRLAYGTVRAVPAEAERLQSEFVVASSQTPVDRPKPHSYSAGQETAPSPLSVEWNGTRLWLADYAVIGQASSLVGSPDRRGVSLTYLHADHLGTTRIGTDDDTGAVAFQSASMPFGDPLSESGAAEGTKQFATHSRDDGSNAVYMMARYYSPTLARFASADPLTGGNRFTYVGNNPLGFVDPLGLKKKKKEHSDRYKAEEAECKAAGACGAGNDFGDPGLRAMVDQGPGGGGSGQMGSVSEITLLDDLIASSSKQGSCTLCTGASGDDGAGEDDAPQPGGPDDVPHPNTGFDPEKWRYDENENYDPEDPRSRPGRWVPIGPGGPNISWDPMPGSHGEPHWDVHDGTKGGKRWVAPDGRELKTAIAVTGVAVGAYVLYRIGKTALGCLAGPAGCAVGALTP